jgi:hypothetical protein
MNWYIKHSVDYAYFRGVAMSQDGDLITIADFNGCVYMSMDFGDTFTITLSGVNGLRGVAMSRDGKYQTIVGENGIYTTEVAGLSLNISNTIGDLDVLGYVNGFSTTDYANMYVSDASGAFNYKHMTCDPIIVTSTVKLYSGVMYFHAIKLIKNQVYSGMSFILANTLSVTRINLGVYDNTGKLLAFCDCSGTLLSSPLISTTVLPYDYAYTVSLPFVKSFAIYTTDMYFFSILATENSAATVAFNTSYILAGSTPSSILLNLSNAPSIAGRLNLRSSYIVGNTYNNVYKSINGRDYYIGGTVNAPQGGVGMFDATLNSPSNPFQGVELNKSYLPYSLPDGGNTYGIVPFNAPKCFEQQPLNNSVWFAIW